MPCHATADMKQRCPGDASADKAPQCRPLIWGSFGDNAAKNIGQDFYNVAKTNFVEQVLDSNCALQEQLGLFAVWHGAPETTLTTCQCYST
jgi:hypothetical protein